MATTRKIKPKNDVLKVSGGDIEGQYLEELTILYSPDVDLFYIIDAYGSTDNKLTPSEMEHEYGEAVVKRFLKAAREKNPLHTRPHKPGKKKRKSGRPAAPYARARAGGGRRKNPSGEPSPKQWRGYFAMHREPWGPSANDGYNMGKYGITSEQYRALLKIAEGAAGMDGKKVTKAQIQKLLHGDKVMLTRADPRDIERVRRAFGVQNPGQKRKAVRRKKNPKGTKRVSSVRSLVSKALK